jgi:hypothetical protein
MKTFRVRFRFRLIKKLGIDAENITTILDGNEAKISAYIPGTKIKDSEWVVISVPGFSSQEEATQFGSNLKAASAISSAAIRLGIDSGIDISTTSVGQVIKDIAKENGIIYRNNIHGIDIFEDDQNIRFPIVSAQGSVSINPELFLNGINASFNGGNAISEEAKSIILLLNYALMRQDPVGQIVFAFSAVESVGQNEKWSPSQESIISILPDYVRGLESGTSEEKDEIAIAIEKGLHRLSLRQGVIRLLDRLNIKHLKKNWDALYSERSTLIHGLAPVPGVRYDEFAMRTINLCGHILLTNLALELPAIKPNIEKYYPV